MAEYLSDKEHEFVEIFKEEISKLFPNSPPINYNIALKFLLARKFDIPRAKALFLSHEQTRVKERLSVIDPFHEKVKDELLSGKFTVLPARDAEGAALALFTVCLHDPGTSSKLDLLRSLLYQLDAELNGSIETQRYGLVFIYDMTDCKFHNFDLELSKKILSLLKDSYPARLRKVLIVNPPVWFKYPFKCLQILLKKKLQERVHMLNASQLVQHLPVPSIPVQLGGHLQYDHLKWLDRCFQRTDIQSNFSPLDVGAFFDGQSVSERELFRKGSMNSVESVSSVNQNQMLGLEVLSAARARRSIHAGDYPGRDAKDFLQYLERTTSTGLTKEFNHLQSSVSVGSCNAAKWKDNLRKNRYADVHCLDETRVRLLPQPGSRENPPPCPDGNDYIHANFVDGYELSHAYICTQGPLPHTTIDFWRMIWDYHVPIIVMLTRIKESGRIKCHQYWPVEYESIENHGDLVVINNGVNFSHKDGSFIETSLLIQNMANMEMREVIHMQFVGWPDYGLPNSSENFLKFLLLVKRRREEICQQSRSRSQIAATAAAPPVVVHCSAGIGRSGTFVAMDVGMDRLLRGDGKINISGTVERIRTQRLGSIQTPDQYVFCHLAIADFITSRGLANATTSPVAS